MTSAPDGGGPSAHTRPDGPPEADKAPFPWTRAIIKGIAALAVFTYVAQFFPGNATSTLKIGSQAPGFVAHLDNGRKLDLHADLGQPLVLTFWASWCASCRAEAPTLSALHDRGILVVGVNLEELSTAQVQAQARAMGITFPTIAGRAELAERYRVRSIPTTYVIASDGTIVSAHGGAASDEQLTEAIEEARTRDI